MNKEYTIGPGWKAFTYIFAITIVAGGIYLFASANPAEKVHDQLIAGVCWLLSVYTLYYSIRKKVTITPNSIINQGAFTRKELLIADIKGYKIEKDNLIIEAKSGTSINISSYTTLKGDDEILEWVAHFKNIWHEEYEANLNELLQDEVVGQTVHDRENKLMIAKKLSSYINYTGISIAIWILVHPAPYRFAVLTGMLFPLLVIVVFYKKRDIMTFNSDTREAGSAYPSLVSALILPGCALLVRTLIDWDLLSYTAVVLPTLVLIIMLCTMFLLILQDTNAVTRKNPFTRFNIGLFILLYSTTATVTVNCEFDTQPGKSYATTLLSQRYTTGKGSAYYLTIDKCGPLAKPTEVTVGKALYYQVSPGKIIKVNTQPGLLHIPWFYISQ